MATSDKMKAVTISVMANDAGTPISFERLADFADLSQRSRDVMPD